MNEYRIIAPWDIRYYHTEYCGDGCCSWQVWNDAEVGDTFFARIDSDGNFNEERGDWEFGEIAVFYINNGYVERVN